VSSDATLLEALRQDPSDEATWAVWLDRLRERGDPIATVMADGSPDERLALAARWFGRDVRVENDGIAARAQNDDWSAGVAVRLRHGHVDRLTVHTTWDGREERPWPGSDWIPDVLRRLLANPWTALTTELEVRLTAYSEFRYEGLLDAITEAGPLAIRRLYVGDDDQLSWTMVPSVHAVWNAAPHLESVTLEGSEIALGDPSHLRLRELKLISGGLPAEPVQSVAQADLPALEDLELWFGEEEYGAECDVAHVMALLHRPFPALRRMGLVNCSFTDRLLERLHEAVWLPRLRELALFGSILTDEGARRLLEHADAYAHLERLDLQEHFIGEEVQAELRARFGDRVDLSAPQIGRAHV